MCIRDRQHTIPLAKQQTKWPKIFDLDIDLNKGNSNVKNVEYSRRCTFLFLVLLVILK